MDERIKITQSLREINAHFEQSWSATHQYIGSIGAKLLQEGATDSKDMAFINNSLLVLNTIAAKRQEACGKILRNLKPDTLAAADNVQEIFNAFMFTNDMIAEINIVKAKVNKHFGDQTH